MVGLLAVAEAQKNKETTFSCCVGKELPYQTPVVRFCVPGSCHFGHATLLKKTLGVNGRMFDYICTHLEPFIEQQCTNCREPISVEQRVSLTLYYLCNVMFVVSISSISKIVLQTCLAIVEVWREQFPSHIRCHRRETHSNQKTLKYGW